MPKKFPAFYKSLSPGAKLEWLKSQCARALVAAGALQQNQVHAEQIALQIVCNKIAETVPTPAWLAAFRRGETFPPPAEHTPMVRAKHVLSTEELKVYWPAHYVSDTGTLYDRQVMETEQSRQKLGMDEPVSWGMPIRERSLKLDPWHASTQRYVPAHECQLATENVGTLRQIIKRHIKKTEALDRFGRFGRGAKSGMPKPLLPGKTSRKSA